MKTEMKTETRYLKHTFTDEEMKELNQELAKSIMELRRKEADFSCVKKQFGLEIQQIESRITETADKVVSGHEYRNVSCNVIFNYNTGMKIVINPEDNSIVDESSLQF